MENSTTPEMQMALRENNKTTDSYEIDNNTSLSLLVCLCAFIYNNYKKKINNEINTVPKEEIADESKKVTTIQLIPEKIPQNKHAVTRKSSIAGNCLIINTQKSVHGIRRGTQKDVKNLENLWSSRRYKVKTFTNLNGKMIIEKIKKYSMRVNENHEGFIVCILTHGNENGIYGSDDQVISINEIKNAMYHSKVVKNRSFLKFLVLQACRGTKDLNEAEDFDDNREPRLPDENVLLKAPDMRDLSVLYSTCEGYVALRDENDGTPLITSLCKNVDKYGDSMHLEDVLTRVKYEVGRWTEFQAPETSSTCTKNFFLPKAVKKPRIVDGFSQESESQEIVKSWNVEMKVPEGLAKAYGETFQKIREFLSEGGDIEHLNMMVQYYRKLPSLTDWSVTFNSNC